MPLGPFGEVVGTTGTLEALGPDAQNYKTKVIAPRNPKLVKQDEPDGHKMTPSKFLFDMSLSTEQKLANTHIMKVPRKTELLDMGDTSLQKFSKVNIDEPMFQPFPSEIYFQNFNPFEVYEVPLILRNNDKVPRLVKVTQENSPYFKIISPNDVGHKVGPGLPTTFKVQFMPDERKDYKHELICITEREKFVVPVRAIGARGILDFPDEIRFTTCPVKYANTRTILVRNIGSREAKFNLKAEAPFSVTPDIGTLGVKESLQVTIEYKPVTAGDHRGEMCLTYDTGEEIFISLYGAAQDANVRLDKNSIRIENTYISMANQRTVVITNRSDFIAHFRWTQFSTQDDEDQQRLLQQIELDREENSDTDRFLDECVADPTLRDKLSILSRTFQNRKRAVENDPLIFDDDVVSVEPVEGDIWPNSTFEINVVFKPREATSYTRTAYCDITGRESRLPLRIRGEGIGPKVDFSFDHLDMGNIFIGSRHTYEIVIANKGDIDAIYSVVPNMSIFGPCFAFNPAEGIVMPGGHQAIEVAFSSPYLGDFSEVFAFQVDGQPQQCKITFSGKVVGPTFNFDVAKLKFGTVPFGFLSSQTCNLVNTSLVPMIFHLRVPGDGLNKSVCCTHDITEKPLEPGLQPMHDPKEFEIVPSKGVIPPQSEIKVTVNLVPNTIKKYDLSLVVDVERVGEEIMALPISAKAIVPEISNLTPVLNYGRCFLRHPYEHRIRLHNDTDLAAKYEIIPQEDISGSNPPISYQSPQPKGIIAPHSVSDVPLLIKANALEEQEVPCLVSIFGSQSQPVTVHVMCVGEGPVVNVSPLSLDWGDVPVLKDLEQTVVLSNESFIPAKFTAHMLRPNTVFSVSPCEGVIPAEQSVYLTVTANLDDCVRFQDKLQINFLESQARLIPLQAYGKGTTIVSDPPLGSVLDLGPNFSNRQLSKHFKLTNKGRRLQQLVWLTDGYIPLSKAKKEKLKSNSEPKQNDASRPVFQLTPNRMELQPGDSIDFSIEGFVDGPQFVEESIVCHAIIGRAGGKTPIISVLVRSEFVEPLLNFSTKCAFFRVDKEPADELHVEQKQLVMNNVSSLPLTVGLKLAYPFSMVIGEEKLCETEVCLASGDVYYLVIEFDPKFKDDCHIRTIDEVLHVSYKEHPHVDYVALRGEVYFPNLEFEKSVVDFGCILNDTEVTRYINITNNSPMEVRYKWSFLVGNVPTSVKRNPRPKVQAFVEEIEEEDLGEEEAEEAEEEAEGEDELDALGAAEEEKEAVQEATVEEDEQKDEEVQKSDDEDNKAKGDRPDSPIDVNAPEKGQLDEEEKSDNEEKEKDITRAASILGSRLSLREEEEEALRSNRVLTALLEADEGEAPEIGVEEVFDILPLYGCLQPGDTEQVTFTFYGHADIWGEVKAICEVEGGPTYELKMTGEASLVEYTFNTKKIDYGKVMYNQVATSSITLINSGKVGFQFSAINMDPALQKRPLPAQPVMVPHSGYIEPFGEQQIEVKFLPGTPENFRKSFQIQVAHFEPDSISLMGEGVFPRVSLDLPRLPDTDGIYETLEKEARINLAAMMRRQQHQANLKADDGEEEPELMKLVNVDENGVELEQSGPDSKEAEHVQDHQALELGNKTPQGMNIQRSATPQKSPLPSDKSVKSVFEGDAKEEGLKVREPTELELHLEIERLAVRDFALERMNDTARSYMLSEEKLEGSNTGLRPANSNLTVSDTFSTTMPKAVLPDYLLDFGYVVLGTMRTHVVRATNTGSFPVSFRLERQAVHLSGFHIELDRVKNLPGAPDNEALDFVVSFDPRAANLQLGALEVVVPIYVVHGPVLLLRLRAHVTMPDMEVSDDVLEFGDVRCGECKVVTVQLHNHQKVKCDWDSTPVDNTKQLEKHVPMHLRRKMRQTKKKPRIFEVLPPTGTLMPGQRVNVQVKFMPTEEKFYESRLPIRIAQSSQRLLLLCHGQGLEPRLEFERTLVEFGPILPHSPGDDQEIIVRNPTPFPIEFYSLEFDSQYLEEEKVLRLMRGYDEYNTLLLPPRAVNDKLPHELLDFYDETLKKLEEEEKAKAEAEAAAEAERREREEKEREEKEAELFAEDPENGGKIGDSSTPAILTTAPSRTETPHVEPVGGLAPTEATPAVEDPIKKEDLLEERMKESVASGPGVGDLEITPVSAAIARHLGIDLTPEGKAARNRRGIAIVVNGAPMSGKTSTAVALAKTYEAALLTIDGIVLDAITNGTSPAGLRARELCSEAARRKLEELRETEGQDPAKAGGLTTEAVQAHTQATAAATGAAARDRKISSNADQKKDKVMPGGRTNAVNASTEGPPGSMVPCSPPPLTAPIARRLSVSASVGGEDGLLSCVLPEDLLVEILAERMQLNDCHRGIVFDGLETLFSQTMVTAANAILKALNNRRFIFFCTLKLDYNILKEQEKHAQEEKAKEAKRLEDEEALWLEEMDEDEYDALSEKEKQRVDYKRLVIKKERIKREQEERAERERIEREAKEEEERRKEEEMRKNKGRKAKAPAAPDPKEKDKKTQTGGKAQGQGSDRTQKSQTGNKGHEGEKGPGSDRPESHATEKSDNQPEEGKKKKDKKAKGKEILDIPPVEEVRDPAKEAEMLLIQRFRTFEAAAKDIQELLEFWDRSTLLPRRPSTPSERSDEDQKDHPASGKKVKGKEKHDKEKVKEQERLRAEKEAEKAAKEAAQAEAEDGDVADGGEEDKKDEVGIPHIIIDCSDKTFETVKKVEDTKALPSFEETTTRPSTVSNAAVSKSLRYLAGNSNASNKDKGSGSKRSSKEKVEQFLNSLTKSSSTAVTNQKKRKHTSLVGSTSSAGKTAVPVNKDKGVGESQNPNNGDANLNKTEANTPLPLENKHPSKVVEACELLLNLTPGQAINELDQIQCEQDEKTLYANMTYAEMLLAAKKLPSPVEVLDGIGMGPQGPPIPPPASFAVMPYPVKRRPPLMTEMGGRYLFVASSPDDPNIGQEDKSKEGEGEDDASGTPEKGKDEQPTPTKGAKGGKSSTTASTEKGRTSTDTKSDRKRSAERKRQPRRNSAQVSPPPGQTTPVSDGDTMRPTTRTSSREGASSRLGVQSVIEEKAPAKQLTIFRWTVPASGEVTLKLRFSSDDLGQFDQTLNFEIVGTRRRYQMFCRGICAFPTISKEPRIVFPSRKKNRRHDEIVHKKYILMQETFHFGPLLVGKSREKYREGKYPENMETFTVLNTSPLEADISFCFLNDSKGETYLLEPPTMLLKPGQSDKLTVWAYPKVPVVTKRSPSEKILSEEEAATPEMKENTADTKSKQSKPHVMLEEDAEKHQSLMPDSEQVAHATNTPDNSQTALENEKEKVEVKKAESSKHHMQKKESIAPNQTKKTSPGHYEDAIVCCVRENPEPIVFKICCDGFRPELELDKKQLHFDKVLLHRKDTKTIYLRNSTQLPVAWKLSGLENLGDDFTVAADSGIVEPLSEYPLQAYFRAMKAVQTSRKMIRMEISDADNIMGVVHTEPIQVIAEAYDVALDMSFPKDPPRRLPAYMLEARGPNQAGRASVLGANRAKMSGQAGKSSSKIGSPIDGKVATFVGPTSSRTQIVDVVKKPSKKEKDEERQREKKDKQREKEEKKKDNDTQTPKSSTKESTTSVQLSKRKIEYPTFSLMNPAGIGTDGGLDFGTIKVNEETKQTCTLKNKGKYEIAYNFLLENVDPRNPDVTSLFSVIPSSGKLSPLDRPTQVQVIFKSSREVIVKDVPILKCQVIEPTLGDQGETIASIPVKVSVKAVFSKFNISPTNDINFGALLVNSKKTRTFTIENKGEFDFKYTITKKEKETHAHINVRQNRPAVKGEKNSKSRDDSSSAPSVRPKKADSVRQDAGGSGQSKLTLGMFTIFPAFGIILPNGNQVITVDCIGENQGKEIQDISIDITERDPNTYKGGVPYRLVAEACIPTINVDDVGSIFEEHRVCKNLSVWQHANQCSLEVGGVYGEEERKFVFNNVIVGRKAKARFKISNTNKVPCDVVFSLKPVTHRGAPRTPEVFDLDPPRMQIPNHSHMYATVTFTPPSMQSYSAIFEASIEGVTPNQARGKSLTFEVSGEGNLPRITVAKPTVRNKRGQPLLLFKRNLIGRSESLPFELVNDGTLPSKVDLDLHDPDNAFMLKPTLLTKETIGDIDYNNQETRRRPHTASVIVNPEERATFEVVYRPSAPNRSQADLKVSVTDNQYEDSIVQMVGEGYEDDVTIDNIGSVSVPIDPEKELGNMADDDVSAAKPNLMQFGDCFVDEARTLNLTMTNHSKTDCVRFQWPDHSEFKFSPQVGHLHASCTKDVTVNFCSDSPKTFAECPIQCKLSKITFDKPVDQVCDWDDKIQVVKWVDIPPSPVQTADSAENLDGEEQTELVEIMETLLFGSKSALITPNVHRPAKKKMVDVEPEPSHTEIADSSRNLELLVSAITDYTQCSCKVDTVHFKDTLMFQTRVYSIELQNEGQVALDYTWQVVMDSFTPMLQRSVTFMSEGERPESRVDVVDSSYIPYFVEPSFGTIPAGRSAKCIAKFAPLDANDYEGRLICSIPHMGRDEQGPVVGVKGRSLMPYCHFELEDSDYLSSARRNPELRGPGGAPPGSTLDPTTRVLEFNVCGISSKCVKEFGIINPTNTPFTFHWICEDEIDPKRPPCFRCIHPEGEIRSGRKFKVGFEFVSSELDIVESFWRFVIPSQAISLPFLLVGHTREPDITLDRSHLNFKALLVGREAVETVYLTNNENSYFGFNFAPDSCHSEGYASHLTVEPMHGQIPPNSRLPINLYFSPTSEKEVNFNVRCTVQRKVSPITLNVKAEGYTMNCILQCEDSAGNRVELSDRGLNQINFGEVEVNENAIRHLFILNSGKFNLDYTWEINPSSIGAEAVSVMPPRGGVMCGETQQCSLSFCPTKRMSVRGCELSLVVSNGPTYLISVLGLGVTPGLHFSFRSHNFGSCFIHKTGFDLPTKQVALKLTNKDKKEISIDCLYESTPQLTYHFEACVVGPGDSVDVPFVFCPRRTAKYHEVVTFEVNGLSKQKVEFFGTGSEMKIEVADPAHKCVNLGARMVGEQVRKLIPIINHSPAPITFTLALTPTEPGLQNREVLSVNPREPITLEAKGGTAKVEVWFRPKARIPQFTEEVLLECSGMSQPLFVVKGSCLGMEISLDSDSLSFGTVYQRSSSTRKIVMSNTGDMNTRFQWDIKRFKPDFSISPVEGYITPGMDVTFDVEFHPTTISGDVRYDKLKCRLDGGPHKPVTLTLTGSCTGIPPVREVQNFAAVVRGTDTKQLMIPNKSNQLWNLKPIIDGEQWTGPVTFTVEPQMTKPYELVYAPLTMTTENKKHTGSIFFPLPDGSGLLFNLTGSAEAPKPVAKIQRDIPCKTGYTELLSVHNWLKKPQRFKVKIEALRPEKLEAGTTVKGMEYVDVPANTKKDYKLNFYAYKEGQSMVKVTFINETTGEYQFYEVTFRATKPGTISVIKLSTPVRQSVPHQLTIENPLGQQVMFSVSCTVPEVLLPSQLVVPANSQGQFSFEYQPLKVGEVQGRLEMNCTDLGSYSYDLILTATPGAPEKAIYFRTGLGSNVTQIAKFLNFAKQKTDYVCKIDNPDFHVDKSVPAAPGSTGGTEVALDVVFEPSRLGEHRAMLTVSSQLGGEYTFPLFGTCVPPKPQGPFTVKAGSNTAIIFHNVFSSTTPFTFQVDNPLFHLTKQGESIRAKKDHRVQVGFDGNDTGSKAAVMGKLIISCARSAGGNSNVQWVYYLKGVTP